MSIDIEKRVSVIVISQLLTLDISIIYFHYYFLDFIEKDITHYHYHFLLLLWCLSHIGLRAWRPSIYSQLARFKSCSLSSHHPRCHYSPHASLKYNDEDTAYCHLTMYAGLGPAVIPLVPPRSPHNAPPQVVIHRTSSRYRYYFLMQWDAISPRCILMDAMIALIYGRRLHLVPLLSRTVTVVSNWERDSDYLLLKVRRAELFYKIRYFHFVAPCCQRDASLLRNFLPSLPQVLMTHY